jgi:hypothetical protein
MLRRGLEEGEKMDSMTDKHLQLANQILDLVSYQGHNSFDGTYRWGRDTPIIKGADDKAVELIKGWLDEHDFVETGRDSRSKYE